MENNTLTTGQNEGRRFRIEVLYGHGWEPGFGSNRSDRGFTFRPDKARLPEAFVSSLWTDTTRSTLE